MVRKRAVIYWGHPNGPMLLSRNGGYKWLTLWERFLIHFKFKTPDDLDTVATPKTRAK